MTCTKIKKDISETFENTIEINKNYIIKSIINRDVDKEHVEDFYQDVVLDLWNVAVKYPNEFEINYFVKASIKLTVKRLFTTYVRKKHKERILSNKISNKFERAVTFSVNESVLDLIKTYLSQEEFDLLYDFYFLEMTNEEMGNKYNKPKTTIRDRRIKIQKKLKEVLLDDGYDFDDLTK